MISNLVTRSILRIDPAAQVSVIGDDINQITWHDGNPKNITVDEIQEKQREIQAEHNATEYKRLREPEYPAIGDQLDALLKHLNYRRTQGDELVQELDDIISSWLSVKQRFPKND